MTPVPQSDPNREPTLRELLDTINIYSEQQSKFNEKIDERFYQLSKDTLGFARNVIVTAAVVAVLAPLLKESLSFALDLIKTR
jgi:hypothetical protein